MPIQHALTVLGSFFLLLVVGALLRASKTLPATAPDVVRAIVVDVTMPALIVSSLARARFAADLVPAVVAATAALLVALVCAAGVAKLLGATRGEIASAGVTGSFANTGFLGVPFIAALYADRAGAGAAAASAIVVDTVDTTILLWTLGAGFVVVCSGVAAPEGGSRFAVLAADLKALARRPMVLAVVLGLALHGFDVRLPEILDTTLARAAEATPVLVFLFLGLSLDLSVLRGRVRATLAVVVVKLVVAPAVALAVLLLLDARGEAAEVAVLQSAMPSAVVSVVVASTYGGDRPFAAACAVLSTLLALVTLPATVAALTLLR